MLLGEPVLSLLLVCKNPRAGERQGSATEALWTPRGRLLASRLHRAASVSLRLQVPLERLLVIYDDLDTTVGAVRLRAKGGTGGHNGMRSIHQRLGGKSDFPRLRIGIGRPTTSIPIASYVTQVSTFSYYSTCAA